MNWLRKCFSFCDGSENMVSKSTCSGVNMAFTQPAFFKRLALSGLPIKVMSPSWDSCLTAGESRIVSPMPPKNTMS